MDRSHIEALLNDVRESRTTVQDALERLRDLPFEDMGFAKLDHHRSLRTGMPEVIFASGKTTTQVAQIFERMANAGGNVLATRASKDCFEAVTRMEPRATYHETARAITLEQMKRTRGQRKCLCGLRRDERLAGGGRGCSHCPVDGQQRGTDCRCGSGRDSSVAGAENFAAGREGADRVCGDGRCAADGCGWTGECAGAGGADERGYGLFWRRSGAAGHAEYVFAERVGSEYR